MLTIVCLISYLFEFAREHRTRTGRFYTNGISHTLQTAHTNTPGIFAQPFHYRRDREHVHLGVQVGVSIRGLVRGRVCFSVRVWSDGLCVCRTALRLLYAVHCRKRFHYVSAAGLWRFHICAFCAEFVRANVPSLSGRWTRRRDTSRDAFLHHAISVK